MDNKKNVDSQEKIISAVSLKDKLKNGLKKHSDEEAKLKNEIKVPEPENNVLNEMLVSDNSTVKKVKNP